MSASGHSRVAAMFSLVVACAAGCQDSERDSSASFRSKTNAICKTQRAELEAAEAKSRIGINAQVIALMRRHLDELRRQEPPASIAARMKHWLTAGDQLIGILLRQNRVLTRDLVRVDAAMRRGARKPRRKLTEWDLEHPTASIIGELERLPEYQKFQADGRAILRKSAPVEARFVRLGRELGLRECVR